MPDARPYTSNGGGGSSSCCASESVVKHPAIKKRNMSRRMHNKYRERRESGCSDPTLSQVPHRAFHGWGNGRLLADHFPHKDRDKRSNTNVPSILAADVGLPQQKTLPPRHQPHVLTQRDKAITSRFELRDQLRHDRRRRRQFMEGKNVRVHSMLFALLDLFQHSAGQRGLGASGGISASAQVVERVHVTQRNRILRRDGQQLITSPLEIVARIIRNN